MADFIGIDIQGLAEIEARLGQIPEEAMDAGVELANEYIVNFERLYPPRVQHGEGNPYKWDSDRQRKAYFASNGFGGGIPYQRTQNLAQGWNVLGEGKNQIVVNEVPYAAFVKDFQQSRGHLHDGWDIIQTDIINRLDEIVRRFEAGVKNAIRKLGLGE